MSRLYSGMASLFHAAAMVACLITLLSFSLFALDQVSNASQTQQSELSSQASTGPAVGSEPGSTTGAKKATVRSTIDDANSELASPFQSVVSRSSSEWGVHILQTLLVLLVYGFSFGFAARFIRIHA